MDYCARNGCLHVDPLTQTPEVYPPLIESGYPWGSLCHSGQTGRTLHRLQMTGFTLVSSSCHDRVVRVLSGPRSYELRAKYSVIFRSCSWDRPAIVTDLSLTEIRSRRSLSFRSKMLSLHFSQITTFTFRQCIEIIKYILFSFVP